MAVGRGRCLDTAATVSPRRPDDAFPPLFDAVAHRHGGSSPQVLSSPTFRCFTSKDVIGVEVGGAVKNVIALAAGMCEGLGLGETRGSASCSSGWCLVLVARGVQRGGVSLGGTFHGGRGGLGFAARMRRVFHVSCLKGAYSICSVVSLDAMRARFCLWGTKGARCCESAVSSRPVTRRAHGYNNSRPCGCFLVAGCRRRLR